MKLSTLYVNAYRRCIPWSGYAIGTLLDIMGLPHRRSLYRREDGLIHAVRYYRRCRTYYDYHAELMQAFHQLGVKFEVVRLRSRRERLRPAIKVLTRLRNDVPEEFISPRGGTLDPKYRKRLLDMNGVRDRRILSQGDYERMLNIDVHE